MSWPNTRLLIKHSTFAVSVPARLAALGGLLVSSPDAASSFTFFLMLIPFTSSAFVPIATMPHWLQAFARNQPATVIIDSVRSLLEQKPAGTGRGSPWPGGAA